MELRENPTPNGCTGLGAALFVDHAHVVAVLEKRAAHRDGLLVSSNVGRGIKGCTSPADRLLWTRRVLRECSS